MERSVVLQCLALKATLLGSTESEEKDIGGRAAIELIR